MVLPGRHRALTGTTDSSTEAFIHAWLIGYRRKNVALRLLVTRGSEPRRAKTVRDIQPRETRRHRSSRAEQSLAAARPLLDELWATMLDLGRTPEVDEITNLAAINADLGSLTKALRLIARHYDQTMLDAAAEARADDVRLLMATQQFAKRPAYRHLERRLQLDIRAFFGDYRSAQAAGMNLLLDAADPQKMLAACQLAATQGLGWLDADHSLQLHISLVERLPALLRAYVTCGLIIWDALSDVQLVKIHIASGKLTLMEFEDFDEDPLPRMRRRIKVIVRKLDCDIFEYGSPDYPKPLLYRKSRYLHEDHPGYAEQLAFDEAIERSGVLSDSGFGPTADVLTQLLDANRLAIEGMRLVRSASIPDLDARCGANLTYRELIQCGETRQRLGIANLPLNPATYNALHDLTTQILDPVIEYFGSIRLTYGFSSTELTRNIQRGIAPKLDQHAACERGPRGSMVPMVPPVKNHALREPSVLRRGLSSPRRSMSATYASTVNKRFVWAWRRKCRLILLIDDISMCGLMSINMYRVLVGESARYFMSASALMISKSFDALPPPPNMPNVLISLSARALFQAGERTSARSDSRHQSYIWYEPTLMSSCQTSAESTFM